MWGSVLPAQLYYSSSALSSFSENSLCKSVACCQFNLDRLTSARLLRGGVRGRDRAVQDCTDELLIPTHLSPTHPSAVCLQLTTSLNLLTDEHFPHLPSPPSSLTQTCSPLSAPPPFFFCALPFPLCSSLSPPARSFPRTACSQHPPA